MLHDINFFKVCDGPTILIQNIFGMILAFFAWYQLPRTGVAQELETARTRKLKVNQNEFDLGGCNDRVIFLFCQYAIHFLTYLISV